MTCTPSTHTWIDQGDGSWTCAHCYSVTVINPRYHRRRAYDAASSPFPQSPALRAMTTVCTVVGAGVIAGASICGLSIVVAYLIVRITG